MALMINAKATQGEGTGSVYVFIEKISAGGEPGIAATFSTKKHVRPTFSDEAKARAAWGNWIKTLKAGARHKVTGRLEPQIVKVP
jgi:hypothetical protein